MRGILASKEDHVLIAVVRGLVDLVGRNVEHLSGLGAEPLAVELHLELAFEDEDPLLVGMRMRVRRLARRVAHQRDDHAFAFDASAENRRISRSPGNLIYLLKIKNIFAG